MDFLTVCWIHDKPAPSYLYVVRILTAIVHCGAKVVWNGPNVLALYYSYTQTPSPESSQHVLSINIIMQDHSAFLQNRDATKPHDVKVRRSRFVMDSTYSSKIHVWKHQHVDGNRVTNTMETKAWNGWIMFPIILAHCESWQSCEYGKDYMH